VPLIANKQKSDLFEFDGTVDPKTGLPSGQGSLVFLKDGNYLGHFYHKDDKIAGQFMNGELTVGQVTYATGQYLSGEFKSGLFVSGQGKLITDKFSYEGGLKGNLPHGQGTITFLDDSYQGVKYYNGAGSTYTGGFLNGKINVKGVLNGSDGRYLKGFFKDGLLNGKGIYHTPKWKYEGDLVDNRADGEGHIVWASGKTYTGQWKNDKYNGKGISTDPKGMGTPIYDGFWKDGKQHGQGQNTIKVDGVSVIYNGLWVEGKMTEVRIGISDESKVK
jgi:hypothetical protein